MGWVNTEPLVCGTLSVHDADFICKLFKHQLQIKCPQFPLTAIMLDLCIAPFIRQTIYCTQWMGHINVDRSDTFARVMLKVRRALDNGALHSFFMTDNNSLGEKVINDLLDLFRCYAPQSGSAGSSKWLAP